MKLNKLSALLAASTLLAASSAAMAWESEDGAHSTSASVALGTDYMWRGYSQTTNDPAISGSFDYAHSSGFYIGTWASNVEFGDNASSEIDLYAGFGGDIGESGFSYDVGALRYYYAGENYDWNEYHVSAGYSFFSASINYSNNVYDSSEKGIYYTLGFDYDLPMDIALSAGVGYYDYDKKVNGAGNPDSATDYHIGVSKELAGFGWDLTYIDSDSDAEKIYSDSLTDSRLVFTISKSM
ncbi:MAG: hypothetical protein COA63_007980 [Methylophaga sp.]|nr:hypothetical protein [Methylophaga sp.]